MKSALPILAILTAGALAGCQHEFGSRNQETTKYSVEDTGKFARTDRATRHMILCTGLQEHRTTDGRLEVVANVKNREDRRVEVQVRCVFKDDNGFSTGDESPWKTLVLGEDATEAVTYTALNNLAHKYTIAVRESR